MAFPRLTVKKILVVPEPVSGPFQAAVAGGRPGIESWRRPFPVHWTACPVLMTLALVWPGVAAAGGPQAAPEPPAVPAPQSTAAAAPQPTPAPESGAEASVVAVPTRDIFDVIRGWRHKPEPAPPRPGDYKNLMIAGAPVISYNPASGAGLGAAGNVAFYRGDPDNTRISSLVGSLIGTTKEQLLFNAKIDASCTGKSIATSTWALASSTTSTPTCGRARTTRPPGPTRPT